MGFTQHFNATVRQEIENVMDKLPQVIFSNPRPGNRDLDQKNCDRFDIEIPYGGISLKCFVEVGTDKPVIVDVIPLPPNEEFGSTIDPEVLFSTLTLKPKRLLSVVQALTAQFGQEQLRRAAQLNSQPLNDILGSLKSYVNSDTARLIFQVEAAEVAVGSEISKNDVVHIIIPVKARISDLPGAFERDTEYIFSTLMIDITSNHASLLASVSLVLPHPLEAFKIPTWSQPGRTSLNDYLKRVDGVAEGLAVKIYNHFLEKRSFVQELLRQFGSHSLVELDTVQFSYLAVAHQGSVAILKFSSPTNPRAVSVTLSSVDPSKTQDSFEWPLKTQEKKSLPIQEEAKLFVNYIKSRYDKPVQLPSNSIGQQFPKSAEEEASSLIGNRFSPLQSLGNRSFKFPD